MWDSTSTSLLGFPDSDSPETNGNRDGQGNKLERIKDSKQNTIARGFTYIAKKLL